MPEGLGSATTAGSPGVPQRQRRDTIGVHVLGGTFELSEGRYRATAGGRLRVVGFKQQRPVRLDDQRAVCHPSISSSASVSTRAHWT
jgi:hypothetical protein